MLCAIVMYNCNKTGRHQGTSEQLWLKIKSILLCFVDVLHKYQHSWFMLICDEGIKPVPLTIPLHRYLAGYHVDLMCMELNLGWQIMIDSNWTCNACHVLVNNDPLNCYIAHWGTGNQWWHGLTPCKVGLGHAFKHISLFRLTL